jgi:hypothetical protein
LGVVAASGLDTFESSPSGELFATLTLRTVGSSPLLVM